MNTKEWQEFITNRVRVDNPVNLDYVKVDEAIAILKAAAEGLEEAILELDAEQEYYDSGYRVVASVYGYRLKTQKELDAERERQELDAENARKSKEQAKKAEWTHAQTLFKKYKKQLLELDEREGTV